MASRDQTRSTEIAAYLGAGRHRLLVISEGLTASHTLPDAGEVTIGRSHGCAVRIDHASISRQHAVVRVAAGGFTVEDCGSRNGTRIGERKVAARRPQPVAPGEVIEVGSVALTIQGGGGAAERPRRLWPHGYFEGRLDDECARAQHAGGSFAVLRVDVAAQPVPGSVHEALAEVSGPGDVVAAYGPSELELLLLDRSPDDARAAGDRIVRRLGELRVAARAGVACFPRDGRTAEALIAVACAEVRSERERAREPAKASIVVEDPAMERLHQLVQRVAESTINVLLLGETGVGKEVIAAEIHRRSPRARKPYVRINCAALPEPLVESELFGHERGAFTGAHAAKPGLFEAADGGTLLLDEVGELSPAIQAKLLRVLEERQVMRSGSVKPRAVDVRFLAATNRDLEAEVEAGRFRRDLFFRLNGIALVIPPLRDRRGEIAPLARAVIAEAAARQGRRAPRIDAEALSALEGYGWPGNIRELRNLMERAVLLCAGDAVLPEHLPLDKISATFSSVTTAPRPAPAPHRSLRDESRDLERQRIVEALQQCAGNQTAAAKLLGMPRRTLVMRLAQYDLPRPRK